VIIKLWTGKDFEPKDVPDDILRPLIERLLTQRDWDRNLDRLYFLVRNTKLEVQDWQLREDHAAALAAKGTPTAADVEEADAILAAVEAPDPAAVWDAGTT